VVFVEALDDRLDIDHQIHGGSKYG
jgi:hypothetical protein